MSDLYQGWARTGGVVFHYVSGSPWQLLAPIADFMDRDRFPRGSFHLRRFRVKDRTAREFLENRTLEFKVETIGRLMALLPDRRFVFVGDSGEKDPEVYAQLAARCPRQVAAILIRNVTQEDRTAPRYAPLFDPLASHIERRVFVSPGELSDLVPDAGPAAASAGAAAVRREMRGTALSLAVTVFRFNRLDGRSGTGPHPPRGFDTVYRECLDSPISDAWRVNFSSPRFGRP